MQVNFDLFETLSWTKAYKKRGACVVYVLEYSGKKYVGTTRDLYTRLCLWRGHLIEVDVWDVRVVELHILPVAQSDQFEESLIAQLGTLRPAGHNKNTTGKGAHTPGWHHTVESRAKISEALKGRPKPARSAESVSNYKEAAKKRSKECEFGAVIAAKVSAANKARWADPAYRAKRLANTLAKKLRVKTRKLDQRAASTVEEFQ